MKITSKFLLKDYLKTFLSDGYTQIVDISDKSYDSAIDDAIDIFIERVFEGSELSFISVPLVDGQTTYKLPDNVLTMIEILDDSLFAGAFAQIPGYSFIDALGIFNGYSGMNLIDYVLYKNVMSTYNTYVESNYTYEYNSIYNNLKIFKRPTSATSVIVQCYTYPEQTDVDFEYIYNHPWVKKRSLANILERWYIAYLKDESTLMDGNIKIDKDAIRDMYEKKMQETDDELEEVYCGLFGALYK